MAGIYEEIATLLEIRRVAEAKRAISNALAQSPHDAQLLFFSAYVAWLEEDYEQSEQLCHSVLAVSPDDYRTQSLLVHVYEDTEQYARAEQLLIDLLSRNPADAEMIANYARVMLYTFNVDKARSLTEEALRLDPNSLNARTVAVLLDLVSDDRLDNVHQLLQELVRENPESWHTMSLVCAMLVRKRKFRPALILSQEMLRLDPGNQALVEQIVELKRVTHWSALPLWPMTRYGFRASIVIWVLAILVLRFVGESQSPWVTTLAITYLVWVIYTWIHGPIIARFIKADTAT